MRKTINSIGSKALSCSIRTTSHKLNSNAFSILTDYNSPIIISNVKDDSLELSYSYNPSTHKDFHNFVILTHRITSTFIMSLNISTVGYFNWAVNDHSFLFYKLISPENKISLGHISFQHKHPFPDKVMDITSADVKRAIRLLSVLSKEHESILIQEYMKGIMHLSWDFLFFEFRKEAFGNFYRALENVVTERILKVTKLSNELKQIREALTKVGMPDDIVAEFTHLYELRSNQVMHAQKKQNIIDFDDVYKMKTILDSTLYRLFKPAWTE